jgi:hypothetical protein
MADGGREMIVSGKEAVLQKLVFEVRYRFGFTYLDSCGKTVNYIMREYPEWILRTDQPNPQNAPLVSLRNTCTFNFTALKYSFDLEKTLGGKALSPQDVDEFTEQAESVSAVVNEQLSLNEFTRIGLRMWYLFPSTDQKDAESWLIKLGCFGVSNKLADAFESSVDSAGVSVVMTGENRKFRVAFNGVERHSQVDMGEGILNVRASGLSRDQNKVFMEQQRVKHRMLQNPEHAAMIDVDAFVEEPNSIETRSFIEDSCRQIEAALANIAKDL